MNKLLIIPRVISVFATFAFCTFNLVQAQQSDHLWNNLRFGGGVGLGFGSGFFSATLAPSAIYEVNQTVAFGMGLNGTLNNSKNVYKSTIFGGSVIGLINVIPEVQISTEFEQLKVNRKYDTYYNLPDDNYWSPALYLGVGYRSGNVTVGMRYDVLHDKNRSIYVDAWAPFMRFYF